MRFKSVALVLCSTLLAAAPVTQASAHGRGHHGDGPIIGLFALGAAVVAGTAAVISAPFNALAAQEPPQAYAPPQYAQAPYPPQAYQAPAYYAQAPVYYAAPAQVYYAPPVYYRRY